MLILPMSESVRGEIFEQPKVYLSFRRQLNFLWKTNTFGNLRLHYTQCLLKVTQATEDKYLVWIKRLDISFFNAEMGLFIVSVHELTQEQ